MFLCWEELDSDQGLLYDKQGFMQGGALLPPLLNPAHKANRASPLLMQLLLLRPDPDYPAGISKLIW